MNYELAKQLKAAGFPLSEIAKQALPYEARDKAYCFFCGFPFLEIDGKFYMQPVLEVLIEACNNSLFALSRTKRGTRTNWYCVYNYSLLNDALLETEEYETPEEAVARLWLTLHKK